MMITKRLYKLIISTFVTALCFVVFSIPAFADPLTGAMISAGLADGFVWGGMAGMSAAGVSGSLSISNGYSDPLDWTSGDFNVKITHNAEDNTKVDIELSPDLSKVGNRRIEQFNSSLGLSPGTLHSIGNRYAYRGYDFTEYHVFSGVQYFLGPTVTIADFTGSTVNADVYNDFYSVSNPVSESGNWYNYDNVLTVGNVTGNSNRSQLSKLYSYKIRFAMQSDFGWVRAIAFRSDGNHEIILASADVRYYHTPFTVYSPTVSREQDSVIIDPLGGGNVVTLPDTYVQNITYVEGQTIETRAIVEEVLDAITVAGGDEAIDDSIYLPPPGPTPVPGDTIADTPYSDLHGDLGDVSDTIGIGNGVLEDIKDILDNTTDGLKDTVEDISDALTSTVDGIKKGVNTISQTLTGIASHVAQLVQEIVDADYNWTSGVINNFFNAFTDWFSTLRSHVSIWHYVVEWLSDISTCFAFFWGVQSAAGYRFILPIYAAFAGTVVIAIYRRFGK